MSQPKKKPPPKKPPAKRGQGKKPPTEPPKPEPNDAPSPAGSTPAPASTPTADKLLQAAPRQDPRPRADAPLTMAEEAFVSEYLRNGHNGTAAWMFSHPGCLPTTAAVEASKCIRKPKVAARLLEARQRLAAKSDMDREKVLSEWLAIYTADPNELVQIRAVACDQCYGGARGPGRFVDPDPDCEACAGEGNQVPWLADTRKLSPQARRLYAGIKVTRDGVQVLMHDKTKALENIGRILGVYERDNDQKAKGLTEAVREFFAGLHGNRLPIAKAERALPEPPKQGNPLVGSS